jgi:hypothetical protein|tara:strand:- start:180 stop:587 length:408 start_codon:yes stop_codon:yes gene_type:complete
MAGIGLFATLYSQQFRLGDLKQMGPGFFPTTIGILLIVFGLLVAIPAFFRQGTPIKFETKSFVVILVSIVLFGFLLHPLGLPLAAALSSFISTFAGKKPLKTKILISISIAAITYCIFILGLAMSIPSWPSLFDS